MLKCYYISHAKSLSYQTIAVLRHIVYTYWRGKGTIASVFHPPHTNYFPMEKGKGTIASAFHPLHTDFFPMQKGGIIGVDGGNKLAIV